jgi:outer membrane beta-barrel protein
MKRPAICLCLCLSIVGLAGTGHAKGAKGGGKAEAAPAAAPDSNASDPNAADPNAAPADPNAAPAPSESVTPEGDNPAGANADLSPDVVAKSKANTTLSWQDIVVVPRKAFLKGGRVELAPFSGVSINDNLIRHYAFGADITYFLSDVFSVGIEGQYYVKAFTPTEENVGLQYNRIPTLNRYLYGGSLNFGYVPVYGKFAWFNKQILHWEIFANAGVGATVTEIIPRNPGLDSWKNNLLTVPVGIGARFFLFNWLTVNFALRDFIMADKFEPQGRGTNGSPSPYTDAAGNPLPWSTQLAKDHADQALVNNVMFYAGIGLYLPTKFSYKTPR